MRPKLRSGHEIIHLERGESVIGSLTYGLAEKLTDRHGVLKQLNEILNGTHDHADCVEEVAQALGVPEERADQFISELCGRGHIEDADAGTILSQWDQERYSRSALYFGWISTTGQLNRWGYQECLLNKRVVVLGAGGIGSAIATHMVASGVGSLRLVDFDSIELSNLNRQYLYVEQDIGRKKAEVAAERLQQMNLRCDVTYQLCKLAGVADVMKVAEGADLVFRAADEPDQIPYWVSESARLLRVPWIDCSYTGPVVNCCLYCPGVTGCYRCVQEAELARKQREGWAGAHSESAPGFNAAFGPVVHMAASLAAMEGVRFLAGLGPRTLGRALHLNLFTCEHIYAIEVPKDCSHGY